MIPPAATRRRLIGKAVDDLAAITTRPRQFVALIFSEARLVVKLDASQTSPGVTSIKLLNSRAFGGS